MFHYFLVELLHTMTPQNFMVIGLQVGKLHMGGGGGGRPYQILKSRACLGLNFANDLHADYESMSEGIALNLALRLWSARVSRKVHNW